MMLYCMEHPFGKFGSAVPVSPPNFFPPPSLHSMEGWGCRMGKKNPLLLCKHFLAIVKILVYYQNCSVTTPNHNTTGVTVKTVNTSQTQPSLRKACQFSRPLSNCILVIYPIFSVFQQVKHSLLFLMIQTGFLILFYCSRIERQGGVICLLVTKLFVIFEDETERIF